MAKRILVVDDDADMREAVELILSAEGYHVEHASSAAEAMDKIAANRPDLILLDVMMETDTAGFHMTYKLREDPKYKDIPIVMLTCIEEKTGVGLEPEKSGDYLPVEGYLRKPVVADELKATLARVLSRDQ